MRLSEEIEKGRASGKPPPFVGEVFDETGAAIPMSGCTIHGSQRDPEAVSAISAAKARIDAASPSGSWTWLPTDSWHMTWVRLLDRRSEGKPEDRAIWQGDLCGREADLAMIERLRGADVGAKPPYRLKFDGLWHFGIAMGFWLVGATPEEEARIQEMRDRMEEAAGLSHRPRGIEYRLHLTLAYLVNWPDAEDAKKMEAAVDKADADLAKSYPIFEFGPPEVCLFDDLTEFKTQFTL